MKKLKLVWGNWLKKIKKWEIVKMINYKEEIKKLNDEILDLKKENEKLRDLNYIYKLDREELELSKIKIKSLEDVVNASNKSIKDKLKRIKELDSVNNQLLTKTFNMELEIKSKEVQIEEYKLQIEDLKSDRYLIKKIPSGRTKNTIKTKVSKPMSANVTRYMRSEHE